VHGDGAVTSVSVHTTYLCGSVTVIRTTAGLVFVDTAKPNTAAKTVQGQQFDYPGYVYPIGQRPPR
jgi:hypothetical protein